MKRTAIAKFVFYEEILVFGGFLKKTKFFNYHCHIEFKNYRRHVWDAWMKHTGRNNYHSQQWNKIDRLKGAYEATCLSRSALMSSIAQRPIMENSNCCKIYISHCKTKNAPRSGFFDTEVFSAFSEWFRNNLPINDPHSGLFDTLVFSAFWELFRNKSAHKWPP